MSEMTMEDIEQARAESLAARTDVQDALEAIGEAASALEHSQPERWSAGAIARLRKAAETLREEAALRTPLDEGVPDDWKPLAKLAEGGRVALVMLLGTARLMEGRCELLEAELAAATALHGERSATDI